MALSIPIIFSHMYTLGRIPALRQREFCILFLYRTIEVLWASDKGCHVLKKSPENMLVAVTCTEAVDRLPAAALVILLLGSLPSGPVHVALLQKGWDIPARLPCTDCKRTWRNLSHDGAVPAKAGRVYGQRLSAGIVES